MPSDELLLPIPGMDGAHSRSPSCDEGQEDQVDPRVRRTRKLLLNAFLEVLAEKPFEEITIQDITGRATVNRATFYAHFVDKYALVGDFVRGVFAGILSRRQASCPSDVNEYLLSLLLAVIDHWTEVRSECAQSYRMFESLAEAQIKAQLVDNARAWLLTHAPADMRHPARLDLAATIVSCSVYGAGVHWVQRDDRPPLETFAAQAIPLIAASIDVLYA